MSTTRTATTAHGSVEYETVTCDSCGQEVPKEDAQRFYTGHIKDETHLNYRNAVEVEFKDSTVTKGWACEYCATDPAGFPTARLRAWVIKTVRTVDIADAIWIVGLGAFFVWLFWAFSVIL